MKIIVLGTRGIPDVLGGVETHCQELYPRLVDLGCEIILIARSPYVGREITKYKGVKIKRIFAPKIKSIEAIIHTFLGVLYAAYKRPDILHIHAIGPAIFTPLAKLLGLKVVFTHHGPDYDRQKWGAFAKSILRFGERAGTKYANKVIVISHNINNHIIAKYNRTDCVLLYNGVNIPNHTTSTDYIRSLGLERGRFIIGVGRFVEEKGFHDLIEAYKGLEEKSIYRLVLVGDADHETEYSRNLKRLAFNNQIILTGFIKGIKFEEIFSHAKLFVMSSYHEGLPITLLEALSYDLDVLVSNIPANLELKLLPEDYFPVGDIPTLSKNIHRKLHSPDIIHSYRSLLDSNYNWEKIAEQTLKTLLEI